MKNQFTYPVRSLQRIALFFLFPISYCLEPSDTVSAQSPFRDVSYLGVATIDGAASDRSGLNDALADSTPHNQFGGISAIDWIPGTNRFLALSDRGPKDGAVAYSCRFHEIEISVSASSPKQVSAHVVASTLLKNASNQSYVGASNAIQASLSRGQRLDPEGIRIDANGDLWISDEYGPFLFQFSRDGKWIKEQLMPGNLTIAKPSAHADQEDQQNSSGRRANRGMEGLAITPSGRYLVGVMQSPLLQDGYVDEEGKIIGQHVRLIRFDLQTGQSNQFVYRQELEKNKIHEILALDEERFLVLEQDGKLGSKSVCKSIFEIDLSQATALAPDITLTEKELPPELKPVSKKMAIDLLHPEWRIAETMPEKVEGLCWGKNLPNGSRTLIVATDNDFRVDQGTMFYVFSVGPKAGLTKTHVSDSK